MNVPNKFKFTSTRNDTFIYQAEKQASGIYNVRAVAWARNGKEYEGAVTWTFLPTKVANGLEAGVYNIVENLDPVANGVDAEGNPLNFTKDDLEVGMRVKLANGTFWIVMPNVQGDKVNNPFCLAKDANSWTQLYFVSPTGTKISKTYEIAEVYAAPKSNCFILNVEKMDKLLWTRDANVAKRLQLQADIAELQAQLDSLN